MYKYYVFVDPNTMVGLTEKPSSRMGLTDDVAKLMKYKFETEAQKALINFKRYKQTMISAGILDKDINFNNLKVVQLNLPYNYYCIDIDKKIGG